MDQKSIFTKKKRQNLDFQSRKWAQNANFSNKKNATWSFEMSNFNGKQQQKFKYYVSTSQPDQICDVPKMWCQHRKFLRSNTRTWNQTKV